MCAAQEINLQPKKQFGVDRCQTFGKSMENNLLETESTK